MCRVTTSVQQQDCCHLAVEPCGRHLAVEPCGRHLVVVRLLFSPPPPSSSRRRRRGWKAYPPAPNRQSPESGRTPSSFPPRSRCGSHDTIRPARACLPRRCTAAACRPPESYRTGCRVPSNCTRTPWRLPDRAANSPPSPRPSARPSRRTRQTACRRTARGSAPTPRVPRCAMKR